MQNILMQLNGQIAQSNAIIRDIFAEVVIHIPLILITPLGFQINVVSRLFFIPCDQGYFTMIDVRRPMFIIPLWELS